MIQETNLSNITKDFSPNRRKASIRHSLILLLIALVLLPAMGGDAFVQAMAQVSSTDLEGEIKGAPYKIRMPQNWNGTLLIHLHGYRDKADHPGETDDRSVEAAPGGAPAEQLLLAQGFALAGTAYSDNGYAVKQGVKDTRRLVNFFIERFGRPRQTILLGFSMGTIIAYQSMERYKELYDGSICACSLGAGASLNIDGLLADFGLAYDVTMGWPEQWGDVNDVRDDLDFDSEVAPVLIGQLQNQANFGRFEFIRLVNDIPAESFYPDGKTAQPFLFVRMFFASEARAELERRAGGPVAQNQDHVYELNNAEKAYLATLGVNADQLLATMNARTNITAPKPSRKYIQQHADYSGLIKGPVLALHNRKDGLAHPGNVSVYQATVDAVGRGGRFAHAFVNTTGHCNFTPNQLFASISAMQSWLDTGRTPGPEAFPTAIGFLNDSALPNWPQPFQLRTQP
jgi:pimeloyl-ACP methyl ester carboxylesterase